MKLFYHPMSPFVRKVLIVAEENGLAERIENVPTDTLDEALRAVNPLCKIPALLLDDGMALYDSRVICDYLEGLGTGATLPADPPGRLAAKLLEALGDGIADAVLRIVMEHRRPETDRHLDVIERQRRAIVARLAEAERQLEPDRFTLGDASLACAIGYLEARLPRFAWREDRPALAAWYDSILLRPSVAKTHPVAV